MKTVTDIRHENLISLLDSEVKSIQEMAEKMGKSHSYVSQLKIKAKNIGDKTAREFEAVFNKPMGWMDAQHNKADANVSAAEIKGDKVPVISWVAAGNFCEISDPYPPGLAERWLPCPVPHSESTYALTVTGVSMYNPNGRPSFDDGDIIFVDPKVAPKNKSCVIVRLDDRQEATFKQIIIETWDKYLVPLNPNWPEQFIQVTENATICGVVIGKWVDI